MSRAQKNRFGLDKEEAWNYLPIPGNKMSYQRNIGFRKFLLAPSRILRRRFGKDTGAWKNEKHFAEKVTPRILGLLHSKSLTDQDTIIITSSGPFRYHIIGASLAREFNFKWVADYRDMWSLNHTKTTYVDALQFDYESSVLKGASGLITVSKDLMDQSETLFLGPKLEVQNGHPGFRLPIDKPLKPIVITFTGQLYRNFQRIEIFFEALSNFQEKELVGRLEVRFIGPAVRDVKDYFKLMGETVPSYIKFTKSVHRRRALQIQSKSDFLLAFKFEDERFKNLYSTKIYEYVSSGRPTVVVGSIEREALGNLVVQTRSGVDLSSSDEVFDFIADRLDGKPYIHNPDLAKINELSYNSLVNRLYIFLSAL
jgi:hypothetical protein